MPANYSMCQRMPHEFSLRWDLDSERSRFTSRQNKTRSFENAVISCFQLTRPDCEIERFYTTNRQEKMTVLVSMVFALIRRLSLKPWVPFILNVPVRKFDRFFEDVIQRVIKKKELGELRLGYLREKSFTVIEMWECEPWEL